MCFHSKAPAGLSTGGQGCWVCFDTLHTHSETHIHAGTLAHAAAAASAPGTTWPTTPSDSLACLCKDASRQ